MCVVIPKIRDGYGRYTVIISKQVNTDTNVCIVWFSQLGKYKSMPLGITKFRSINHKLQKVVDTNWNHSERFEYFFLRFYVLVWTNVSY